MTWRVAGALLLVVGLVNVVIGTTAATGAQLAALGRGSGLALAVLGGLTAAAGMLVWRASRLAALLALTVFAILLLVQLGDVVIGGAAPHVVGRTAVLGLLVAVLALPVIRSRTPS